MKKYAKNDVLKYLYGEMPPEEQDDFLDALCSDEELFATYDTLKKASEGLTEVNLNPSENSVNRVMGYARHAAQNPRNKTRRNNRPFTSTGKEKVLNFHHLISVVMVFCTFLTIGIAMFVYQRTAQPQNTWGMTESYVEFENVSLDRRLDFIRNQITDIMEDKGGAIMPVHHDTYRLVNTDLTSSKTQGIVFLNIK
ncbi:MAG TPA: hypothetical protein ENJ82_08340 [Bacteroidetes bacterium]|nr:hypothetical protein [Bacteroidota bacterium]